MIKSELENAVGLHSVVTENWWPDIQKSPMKFMAERAMDCLHGAAIASSGELARELDFLYEVGREILGDRNEHVL